MIPQSNTGTDDYLNLDLTDMVQVMIDHPDSSFGSMVKAIDETFYARMFFASGDNPDATKHPKLEICYSTRTGIDNPSEVFFLTPFPNPVSDRLYLRGELLNLTGYCLFNALGMTVAEGTKINNPAEFSIDVSNVPAGIYFLRLLGRHSQASYRIIITG